jgi:hypothetical protein
MRQTKFPYESSTSPRYHGGIRILVPCIIPPCRVSVTDLWGISNNVRLNLAADLHYRRTRLHHPVRGCCGTHHGLRSCCPHPHLRHCCCSPDHVHTGACAGQLWQRKAFCAFRHTKELPSTQIILCIEYAVSHFASVCPERVRE